LSAAPLIWQKDNRRGFRGLTGLFKSIKVSINSRHRIGMPVPQLSPIPVSDTSAIRPESLAFVGSALNRPECVLSTRQGDLYSADWRGGVAHLLPSGEQRLYRGLAPDGRELRPNGIALNADGSFLVADLGAERGGVFRLERDGRVGVFVDRVDGIDLPPCNFVFTSQDGRTWITVSTRKLPRAAAYRPDIADGFIVMVDGKGARIVADQLGYTNEAAVDPSGRWLYVNETFARRLSRFPIGACGDLGRRELVSEFGAGTFPDGIAFDVEGCAWITSIVSNRIIRVFPDGCQQLILEDADAEHVAWVERAFQNNELGRPHLDTVRSERLQNLSSLAFGGPDLRTAYLGCLLGDRIATLRLPVAGHPLTHWNYH
jgi:sugar lactone lactonase YvrE